MNPTYSKRVVILVALLCAFACAASADTVYNVSGTFQPSSSSSRYTGLLNGGTFSGTFSATLPITSGSETISTFDINLFEPSSTTPLVTLSNTTSGDIANIDVETSNCAIGSSITGPCDLFIFANSSATDFLQLLTPTGFTGGSVYPGFNNPGTFASFAGVGGQAPAEESLVASGSIDPAAEPGSFLLLGLVLVAGLRFERKQLLA